jgi:potassium intermediate/small conductance calcium-activated channel subfamily N protein 2
MTTVGYGDFAAKTDLGRLIIFAVCIFGILIISMMVVTMASRVTTNSFEGKAITVLQKLEVREELIIRAGFVITVFLKMVILSKYFLFLLLFCKENGS